MIALGSLGRVAHTDNLSLRIVHFHNSSHFYAHVFGDIKVILLQLLLEL